MSPRLPWRTSLSRRLAAPAPDHLRSSSSASRKTSGRLSSLDLRPSLDLPGLGFFYPENCSGQAVGLRVYPASKNWAWAIGRIGQGPTLESAGNSDLGKEPHRIRSTRSVGLHVLNSSVSMDNGSKASH